MTIDMTNNATGGVSRSASVTAGRATAVAGAILFTDM